MKENKYNIRFVSWDSISEEELSEQVERVSKRIASDKEFVALLKRLEKM
ncbi:hypothetical protein [Mycoplasma yeatsii]|uniref:Uncharacterized protein n=1 Tax=Mycoplasma yeatsii TaxID=51365 RepID=A0ABU0NDM2_9MOLU|nr:hypothetical protein [Mycoplasma yeatsii]MDQ0567530.1 hypothetical protein [Mycoplasma yeatsii]